MPKALQRRVRPLLVLAPLAFACAGGGSGTPPNGRPPPARLCESALPGTIGAVPLKNDTSTQVDLAGSDDLLMSAMSNSGCFTVVEREQLAVLIEELRLCTDDNPNKEYMDCESAAKKGKLLGMKTLVTGGLTFFEPKVKGADLAVRLPGIGGIEMGREYAALRITLRAVDVETAKVVAAADATALVPSDKAGLDLSSGGFGLRAAAFSKTPFADALSDMLRDAVAQLHQRLREG